MRRLNIIACLLGVLMALLFLSVHIGLAKDFDETSLPKEIPSAATPSAEMMLPVETVLETKQTNPLIPVLMYHILLDGRNDAISIDPKRFKEQMTAVKEAGYTTITDYELADHLDNNTKLPDKPILITFDDGYKSVYTEAYPALEELGMKATVNVITSRIHETPNTLHTDEYEKITWPDARTMQKTILVQAHTWDSHYKKANALNEYKGVITGSIATESGIETQEEFEKRVVDDFILSKKTIEEKMGYEVVSLSYPYGDYSADTIRLAQLAGYKIAFTVNPGMINRETASRFELKRITANGAYSGEQLLAKIEEAR